VAYAKETYFKHLRLYEYVFNNKTASELKRITFTQEEAKVTSPLGNALMISDGRPKEPVSRVGDRSRQSKEASAIGGDSVVPGGEEEHMEGDMEGDKDEEEMDQDEQEVANDQDVKPDQSVKDASVHEEENQENFDTDIRNAGIGLDEKLTL